MCLSSVVFDLDGVITKTALVHAAAWKDMFDEYLRLRQERDGESFMEFSHEDYRKYVDGKPRYKGVESFLSSRGIDIPFGEPSDAPDKETVCGLGNRKNIKFREVLEKNGVEVYQPAVDFVRDLKSDGIHVGVASSSKNCQFILKAAGIEDLFEVRIDGVVSEQLGLRGKPEGDIFVTAAKKMGAEPKDAVVVEDAVAGVKAGKNGGFGLVIGVARENNAEQLKAAGADIIVSDFKGITADKLREWFAGAGKRLL